MGCLKKPKPPPSPGHHHYYQYITSRGNTKFEDLEWEMYNWNLLKFQGQKNGVTEMTEPHPVCLSLSTVCRCLTKGAQSLKQALCTPSASPPCCRFQSPEEIHARRQLTHFMKSHFNLLTSDAPGCVRWRALPLQSAPSRGWSSAWLASPPLGRRTWGLPEKH